MNFNQVCLYTLRVVRSCPCCWPPPARCTHSNPHSAGGTSAPNRTSSSRRRSPLCADVPVLQQNTQARRQRTACANILIVLVVVGFFFCLWVLFFFSPPLLFKWLSFRQEKMPVAGCYEFPTGDAEPAIQATAQTLLGICYRDRLQIKSRCLLGLPKDCRGHQKRRC